MVGAVGFEPTANGLKGRCSTVELHAQKGQAGVSCFRSRGMKPLAPGPAKGLRLAH